MNDHEDKSNKGYHIRTRKRDRRQRNMGLDRERRKGQVGDERRASNQKEHDKQEMSRLDLWS